MSLISCVLDFAVAEVGAYRQSELRATVGSWAVAPYGEIRAAVVADLGADAIAAAQDAAALLQPRHDWTASSSPYDPHTTQAITRSCRLGGGRDVRPRLLYGSLAIAKGIATIKSRDGPLGGRRRTTPCPRNIGQGRLRARSS